MIRVDKISLLDENKLKEIKNDFYNSGLLYFDECDLTIDEIVNMLCFINELDPEDHSNMKMLNFSHDGQKRLLDESSDEDREMYIQSNWHVDISNLEDPETSIPCTIAMNMNLFKCGKNNGNTIFVDSVEMLNKTPNHIKDWMKKSHVIALSGQSLNTHNTPGLDQNGNLWPPRIFPCILSNSKTKKNSFMFTGYCFSVLSSDKTIESEYKDFVYDYLSDQSNWIVLEWSENALVVWDNTRYIHTYSGGWDDGERVFNRFQSGFMIPRYSPFI